MTDEHIAAHEAGHAFIAHLMGDEIREVDMYTGEQAAAVRPVNWPPTRATLLAGVVAETLLGYAVNPVRAQNDMNNAAPLPVDPDAPSPRTLMIEHLPALGALRDWFTEARIAKATIPGSEVHEFLSNLGCDFGAHRVDR